MTLALTLAGGSFTFLSVVAGMFLAMTFGLYTRKGSGINQHPYANFYGDATGAREPGTIGSDRVAAERLTRGTR